jgi:hypothetical protein
MRCLREFITLSALNDTIENQDVTIVGGLKNKDILVQGLFDVKDFLDLDSHSFRRKEKEKGQQCF